ncbi:MAG TPA: hypothetical protein P5165_06320, partial [Spirochaetia bacterium]|nr:hypothetical protein [Spirochaetia bacterium]
RVLQHVAVAVRLRDGARARAVLLAHRMEQRDESVRVGDEILERRRDARVPRNGLSLAVYGKRVHISWAL